MVRFLLFISCLFLINTTVYAENNPCKEHQCIAVIDAGSTGSRLHLFSYKLDKTKTPINITEVWSKKVTPGFASIEINQNIINSYMTALFSGAPAQQQIPVYFYATAGMRLIPQSKQKLYYQNLQGWFNQNAKWQLVDAKTITGNEEALYDWLSVNYHLNTFRSAAKEPIGVIDIGGASTQIAFPVKNNAYQGKGTPIELNLYGQHITLFVHSFLGLGQNEMTHQLLSSPSCFADNYPLPDGENGQGDASECAQEIESLINGVHKANNIVQPILGGNPVNSWYAIGGIANIAESKPFQFTNSQLTIQDFLQQANNLICHQQWDTLSNEFPDNQYLDAYCLFPAFYYSLMVNGYGLSPAQQVNYIPTSQNLDWTLGVVLHH